MPRVPVYPSPDPLAGDSPSDGYLEKLAKYVPAEAVSLYVGLVAIGGVKDNSTLLIGIAVVALVGNLLWLLSNARDIAVPAKRPRWWFYVLAAVSFAAWAIVTTPELAAALTLPTLAVNLMLPLVVFFVPLIDKLLTPQT